MDGLLVLDKPVGPTSHDVVARVRAVLGERRIGHTGTLDPGASGVLPLVIGRATRLAQFISGDTKTYEVTIRLGQATDSGDADGQPIGLAHDGPLPDREAIDRALEPFRRTYAQQPPAFSAKKVGGTRSYRLARRQRTAGPTDPADAPALPAPVSVTAHAIEVLGLENGQVTLRLDCSSGFYVRALAHDLGVSLRVGAHVTALRRTRCGPWTAEQAIPLERLLAGDGRAIGAAALVPLASILPAFDAAVLTVEGARRAANGRDLDAQDFVEGEAAIPAEDGRRVRLLDAAGALVGIAARTGSAAALHPSVILV